MQAILTVSFFPEIFQALNYGIPARAEYLGVKYEHWAFSRFSSRRDGRVDDRSFGGGPGMVIQPQVIESCVEAVLEEFPRMHMIIPDPLGSHFTQAHAKRWVHHEALFFCCGRYEGLDERIFSAFPHERVSIGDVVVSGGELPAALMIDALIRELEGALGHPDSKVLDSFQDGLLDFPHYTRPWSWKSKMPPDILASGHAARIARWRAQQAIGRTWLHRLDLLRGRSLSEQDIKDLQDFIRWEHAREKTEH